MNTMSGIARSSLLVDLSISTYSGRVQDKNTRDEVTAAKGARSKRAASVYKSLFAECTELEDITKFQARLRQANYKYTKPWLDSGVRLLPATLLDTHKDIMYEMEREFWALVDKFLDKYDTLVAAAAFQLGNLFDRSEYLTRSQVRRRFGFYLTYTPMPTSGDFRLDIESETQRQLVADYEKRMQDMLDRANRDSWEKIYGVLTRIQKQLAPREEGKRGKIYDSLLGNAHELCQLLEHFNVSNDPELTRMRRELLGAIDGVTTDALKTEDDTREVLRRKVDALIKARDWGLDDESEVEAELADAA